VKVSNAYTTTIGHKEQDQVTVGSNYKADVALKAAGKSGEQALAADRSNTLNKVQAEAGQSCNIKEIEAKMHSRVLMQQEGKRVGHECVHVAANSSSNVDSTGNVN